MKKKESNEEKISKYISYPTYQSYIDVDYDRNYNCDENCGGICRCTTISNVNIKFDKDLFIKGILEFVEDEQKLYVSAFLNNLDISSNNFDAHVTSGYYGEEISGVTTDCYKENQIMNFIKGLSNNSLDNIKNMLKTEYGYLPSYVEKTTSASLQKIDIKQINLPDDYIKISDKLSSLPIILIQENYGYKIIDGRKRLIKAKNVDKLKKIEAYVLC